MTEDTVQLVAAAIIALSQLYMIEPWKFPIFAAFWDWTAKICGILANVLGWISIRARHNYFISITETT